MISLQEFARGPYWADYKKFLLKEIEFYRDIYENKELTRDQSYGLVNRIKAIKDVIRKTEGNKEEFKSEVEDYQ